MYLNHPLVSGFPLTLRQGDERDREYVSAVFAEVWAEIPESDRVAILSRGYGSLAIDILGSREFDGPSDQGGEIRLKRSVVDTYPRKALVNLVARELAYKVDNMENPHLVARLKKPRQNAQRRVASILERWGFPPHEKMVYTPADEERIKASRAAAHAEDGSA